MTRILLAAGLASLALAGPAQAADSAFAAITGPEGSPLGQVDFTELAGGVLVRATLEGLTPGSHAIHLHETGACAPDFAAAGGHLAGAGAHHGFADAQGPHAGDLPNLLVGADGKAAVEYLNPHITLGTAEGRTPLFDADGTSVIIHEGADDYASQPSGAAGGRAGCGVVQPAP